MSSAPYPPFSHRVAVDGVEAVIAPRGELELTTCEGLERAVRQVRADGAERVVVDLRDVTFMDSAGLRMLISVRNEAKRDGFALELVPGPRDVQRVFELTAMQSLFDWRAG